MTTIAGALLRQARSSARLTQVQLARRAGVTQSVVSAYESGRREPSVLTLARLIDATGHSLELTLRDRPAATLRQRVESNSEALLRTLGPLGAERLRLFGSAARGDETAESDIDILVDLRPDTGLFSLARMTTEAERILGRPVDLVPADSLKPEVAHSALVDAIDL